ncbi:MAG: agmatine deiminase family protein [Helicobacteraceae bacterium]
MRLFAKWERQDFILLSFPSDKSPWRAILPRIRQDYKELIRLILPQKIVLITDDIPQTKRFLSGLDLSGLEFFQYDCNDTWTRDYGAICTQEDGKVFYNSFTFNGWGNKFAAEKDNAFNDAFLPCVSAPLTLEGGAIETDGAGTFMARTRSILNPNRNAQSKEEVEQILAKTLGVKRFLWLEHGELLNDDTDAHIDMLARFCPGDTIAYASCADAAYPHYKDLAAMRAQLQAFRTPSGKPYDLVALPLPSFGATPATYCNFLTTNTKLIVPAYGDKNDALALGILQELFPRLEAVPFDCRNLISQGGAVHCASMNFYA